MSAVVRILPSGHQFVVESDEPLLQAALRSGLALEFGCTNGSCGECKGRVREGEVRRLRFHDFVIRASEKRDGVVLLCCCTADRDVVIEAGEARGPDDIPAQSVRARLYKHERVTEDVVILNLRVMRGKVLRFLAGQHVRLKLVGGEAEDISIASCPCDGLNLEFHLDLHHGSGLGARALAGIAKSDRFVVEGPLGRFFLAEDFERPLAFITEETAIAPVKSIIEHAINLECSQPIHLYWHTRRRDGHYLHNYFRSLADALDDLRYIPVEGPVTGDTLAGFPEAAALDVYLAGGEEFAGAARAALLARGVREERLFVDGLSRRPRPAPGAGC